VRLVPVVVLLAVLAGCGSEAPAEYSDETRANVLASCADDTDGALTGDVCACAYRSIRTRLPYERFAEIDQDLRARPGSPLPDDVLELVAGCIVEVGEL
jgi:hypothetical protein